MNAPILLAFINDVRTFLSNDTDENVIRTVANIRALKKRFEANGIEKFGNVIAEF